MEKDIEKKEPKPFYDETLEVPYECEKCGHKGNMTKRVYSKKVLMNEPVKPEYDIQHFVEPVSTIGDFTNGEDKKDEDEEKKKDEDTPDKENEEGSGSVIDKTLEPLDEEKKE